MHETARTARARAAAAPDDHEVQVFAGEAEYKAALLQSGRGHFVGVRIRHRDPSEEKPPGQDVMAPGAPAELPPEWPDEEA